MVAHPLRQRASGLLGSQLRGDTMKPRALETPTAPRAAPQRDKREVRMLTPSEIESLQRDKAESGKRLLAMFRADRLKGKAEQ